MTLSQVRDLFRRAGCVRLYAKTLAENDNSKNQVYFGGDFESLHLFPMREIRADNRGDSPTFKAQLDFSWISTSGVLSPAPRAQLILYPRYPEVRFSGFLQGSDNAPSDLMAHRIPGRILFLGVRGTSGVIGYVLPADASASREVTALKMTVSQDLFLAIPLGSAQELWDPRRLLISELSRIHHKGWIDSKQLKSDGSLAPCEAGQCGGFTLEAELGIPKNSSSNPDFHGWEIKQHGVDRFDRPFSGSPITLMTPEPTGGFYIDEGVERFVRRYGYPDRNGRLDRLNFGGRFVVGSTAVLTGVRMDLRGFDSQRGSIADPAGAIELYGPTGEVAASWAFTGILSHWSRKHTNAAYVPSLRRSVPRTQYSYGGHVRLGEGTDPLLFLKALVAGKVFYDPGIKLEQASGDSRSKRRSQFRIMSKDIGALYRRMEIVELA